MPFSITKIGDTTTLYVDMWTTYNAGKAEQEICKHDRKLIFTRQIDGKEAVLCFCDDCDKYWRES